MTPRPTSASFGLALVATLAAALVRVDGAHAYCRSRGGDAQPNPAECPTRGPTLSWMERCAGYALDPRVLPADVSLDLFRVIATDASQAWRAAMCDRTSGAPPTFTLSALADEAAPHGYFAGRRNVNSVAFFDRWGSDALHRPGAMAVTVVTFASDTGQLFDADVAINLRGPTNPDGFMFNTPSDPLSADLQTVLTHEFGHVQGLAHSSDRSAVMWFSAGRTFPQRVLTTDDVAGICAVSPPTAPLVCDPIAASSPRMQPPTSEGCRAGATTPSTRVPVALIASLATVLAGRRARRRLRATLLT